MKGKPMIKQWLLASALLCCAVVPCLAQMPSQHAVVFTGATSEPPCKAPATAGTITLNLDNCAVPVDPNIGGSPNYYQLTQTGDATLATTGGAAGQVFRLDDNMAGFKLTVPQPPFIPPVGVGFPASGMGMIVCSVHDLTPTYLCNTTNFASAGGGGGGAWALKNQATCTNVPTGCTTPSKDMSGANLIVAAVSSWIGGGSAVTGFKDSNANSYISAISKTVGNTYGLKCFYSVGGSYTAGMTFTPIGGPGNFYGGVSVLGFSGPATLSLDQVNSAVTAGLSTSLATGSTTPKQPGELLIACLGGGNDALTATVDSGFALPQQNRPPISALAYLVQTTAGSVNPKFSWTNNDQAAAGIMTWGK